MPKFSVPWGKKKGGSSGSVIHGGSSGSEQSKPGAQIFNKDNSVAVFGQTISLEDEEEGGEQGGETDETVDNVLGLLPSESCCPSMSLKYVFIMYTDKDMTTFAVLYSIGNVVAIASTSFLTGPRSQCKKMIHPTRLPAALIFFAAFTITLVLAFTQEDSNLVLLFLIIQWLALIYYAITLFPCAYNFCRKMCAKCCSLAAETV